MPYTISRHFLFIVIFRFVPYLLNIICLNFDSNTISHMIDFFICNSNTVLYQFLKTGTSDRTIVGRDQIINLELNLYPPFNLFQQSQFNINFCLENVPVFRNIPTLIKTHFRHFVGITLIQSIHLYINLACLSVCLSVCLFVSNKRQNG